MVRVIGKLVRNGIKHILGSIYFHATVEDKQYSNISLCMGFIKVYGADKYETTQDQKGFLAYR
jgi:hypothetical protein